MTAPLFDNLRADTLRGGKEPIEVALFVHKLLPKSLLCSEHGRDDRTPSGDLVAGKIIPSKLITWPDEEQLENFRRWQVRSERNRQPIALEFAIPKWLAKEKGLI